MAQESKDTKKSSKEKKNMHNKLLGKRGEKAAAKFLMRKGYKIEDTNWVCPLGEIDLVATYDDVLIFVEVKTRTNIKTGLPEDAVGAKKRRKYESMAAMYLKDHEFVDMPVRFDVVGILVVNEERALIRHHINAFGVA